MSAILYLVAIAALTQLSIGLVLPATTTIAENLKTPAGSIQSSFATFLMAYAVGQIFFGFLSDKFGRKPMLIAGLFGYVFCGLATPFMESANLFIIVRSLEGFFAASGIVLARAIARDWYEDSALRQAMGVFSAGNALVPALSPLLGSSIMGLFGWRMIFALTTGIGIMLLLITLTFYRESKRCLGTRAASPLSVGGLLTSVRNSDFRTWVFCGAFGFGIWYAYLNGASVVMTLVLHLPPVSFGLMQIFTVGSYMAGGLLTSRISDRWMAQKIAWTGIAACIFASGMLSAWFAVLGANLIVTVVAGMCAAFGIGMIVPTANSSAMNSQQINTGAASAVLGFIQMGFGAGCGAFLTAFLQHVSPLMFPVVMLCFAAASMFALLLIKADNREMEPT